MLTDKIAGWLDSRLGIIKPVSSLMNKPIKGGALFVFSLGSLNLFLFMNQVITGIFLMVYYVPSPDHAYSAVKYIQNEADYGFIVRGLHFWGASLMIISLLPWDQKSYWATVVGTNVAGTAPVIGNTIVRILRGGTDVSNLTLTRFFTVHVVVLPWLLAVFALIHLTVLQIVDHTPPWRPEWAKKEAPFYPDQALKDALVFLLAFGVMMALANLYPPHLEPIADPTDTTYVPRPEWYFYFLFQLLKYFQGPLEVVGTMVLPNLFIVLMLLLPFIDRKPELNPAKRPVAMACLGVVAAAYISLTVMAGLAPAAPAPQGTASEGRKIYAQLGCSSCHSINGTGGKVGPALDHVGSRRDRNWLIAHFKDPRKLSPGSIMPKFDYLPEDQLNKLTDYMQTLK
ncbi:MAG: cytochrome b N-terminal domain-containing protein [Nitrospirota bacterium]